MTYQITVRNNSPLTLTASDGTVVAPGTSWTKPSLGNAFIGGGGMNPLTFIDIGSTHFPGDPPQTWGVLISYREGNAVGRYEGGGSLTAVINQYAQVTLSGMTFSGMSMAPITF